MPLPYLCAVARTTRATAGSTLALPLVWLLGCDVFDEELARRVSPQETAARCDTHDDCTPDAGMDAVCVKPAGRCVPVATADCTLGAGDLSKDAIVLGALFGLTGPAVGTNSARLESAYLAVEEINAVGGVAGPGSTRRHLAMVACDTDVDAHRAARHLVDELEVPAIIGPNTSQDTIELSSEISVAGGTLLLSPTAVASSIADLADDDLTWTMQPSDEQRASLMSEQINEIEADLRAVRGDRPIKLSIIHRDDALGKGTQVGLNSLTLNGMTLVENQGPNAGTVKIEPYDSKSPHQDMLVERQLMFAPDIVVLAGLAEAIDTIMVPLEKRWGASARPYYILIDSLRGPELLAAVAGNDDLRRRVRGTGVVPTERSAPVYDAFRLAYQTKYPGERATITGMGPTYDALHAIAYALAATREETPSGASIARGLSKLHDGALEVEVQSTKILAAYYELSAGKSIDAVGTFGPLYWDDRGSPLGGNVEVWCIANGVQPTYASSGLTLDLETLRTSGKYEQCE